MKATLIFCVYVNLALAGFNYGMSGLNDTVVFNIIIAILCYMGYRLRDVPSE